MCGLPKFSLLIQTDNDNDDDNDILILAEIYLDSCLTCIQDMQGLCGS